MRLRAYTWAEFNAWVQVTARAERRERAVRLVDGFLAARGEMDGFKKHLDALDDNA